MVHAFNNPAFPFDFVVKHSALRSSAAVVQEQKR